MEPSEIVTDPSLQAALATTEKARQHCLDILDQSRLAHLEAATNQSEFPASLISEQKLFQAQLARLRGLNRAAVHRVRQTKQETAEARAEVDTLHLNLQNLYYEQRHLRGEIGACEDYDHKYLSLPLISVDEFLVENPDLVDADESTLMEARINHEHTHRESLEQQRQVLLREKQRLIADNKSRKDGLATLDKELEGFIDAARPIQKILETEY